MIYKLKLLIVIFLRYMYRILIREPRDSLIISQATVPGSLGDQAMLDAALSFVLKKDVGATAVLFIASNCDITLRKECKKIFLGPKTLKNQIELLKKLVSSNLVFLPAADTIDGVYYGSSIWIPFLQLCNDVGIKPVVLGFSFSENPAPLAIKQLRECAQFAFNARDQYSRERFERFTNKKSTLVADIAFLLEPTLTSIESHQLAAWAQKKQKAKELVIGVNVSAHAFRGAEEHVVESLSHVLMDYLNANKNANIIFIPHDLRANDGDVDMLVKIHSNLDKEHYERIKLFTQPTAWEVKALAKYLDFAISGRMHFTIACFGMGVPVLSIIYQNKFEGLERHFKLTDTILSPILALDPNVMTEKIAFLSEQREALSKKIKDNLKSVTELSCANFSSLPATERFSQ